MKGCTLYLLTLGALLAGSAAPEEAATNKLEAILINGQNNHGWQVTEPWFKGSLEASGLFRVAVGTSPASAEEFPAWRIPFHEYDVVVLDYNGQAWPQAMQEHFEKYVREGGGVVVIHAADNAFPGWEAYNQIIGVGGWGGRNEKSGPMLYWENGKIVRDTSPGGGGSHGKQHAFKVVNRVKDHPITAGLPEQWMHGQDELYAKLRGPAENLTVLATAWSDPETHGTGRHEPVLMAITYGKGRVFHTVLGHAGGEGAGPAVKCVGFITTLQRGAEWAATGEVTQTVPDDFPSASEVCLRESPLGG
jgi:type 1 glutamine amidotransferase